MIEVTATPFLWAAEKGSWHFLPITDGAAAEIRLQSLGLRGGFGSVPVLARIADVEWRTSLFPHSATGGYLLPLKADIRRRAGLAAGQEVTVVLQLLG